MGDIIESGINFGKLSDYDGNLFLLDKNTDLKPHSGVKLVKFILKRENILYIVECKSSIPRGLPDNFGTKEKKQVDKVLKAKYNLKSISLQNVYYNDVNEKFLYSFLLLKKLIQTDNVIPSFKEFKKINQDKQK